MNHSNRYPFLKHGGYALLMLALFVLQSSRGTAVYFLGASVNVMPFFVAAAALLDGPYAGGAFGFFAGVLLTLNGTGVEGFGSLGLGLFGVAFGLFGTYYLRAVVLSALAGGLVYMALEAVFHYVFYDLPFYGMDPRQALTAFGVRLALSLPAGALTYVFVRAIHRRFTEENT